MTEKIIYINNISQLPDVERKIWVFSKNGKNNFTSNIGKNDILWFIIVKPQNNEVYRGNIKSIIKNCSKDIIIIIFSNIVKIDYVNFNNNICTINKLLI